MYFEGSAPIALAKLKLFVFEYDNEVIVYYLPGTSGWGSTYDGVPAVMLGAPNPAGSLQVTILPAGAITAGAQWQVDAEFHSPAERLFWV